MCEHITVRHPDGHLVDILGGHPDGLPGSKGAIERDVDESYIDDLVVHEKWAAPDEEAAQDWIDGVLERAAGPPDGPHGGFAMSGEIGGYEVQFEWRARAYMEVQTGAVG